MHWRMQLQLGMCTLQSQNPRAWCCAQAQMFTTSMAHLWLHLSNSKLPLSQWSRRNTGSRCCIRLHPTPHTSAMGLSRGTSVCSTRRPQRAHCSRATRAWWSTCASSQPPPTSWPAATAAARCLCAASRRTPARRAARPPPSPQTPSRRTCWRTTSSRSARPPPPRAAWRGTRSWRACWRWRWTTAWRSSTCRPPRVWPRVQSLPTPLCLLAPWCRPL
mmetsp:Transcript_11915/g.29214  ORF Transcript_11915/g.29214 Transcript_11915/m.29214 type:complete len:218 (+) Transcript_11915:180-833(+)